MKILTSFFILVFILIIGLTIIRTVDEYRNAIMWKRLSKTHILNNEQFSTALVEDLPKPVQLYFKYMIMEGTPLIENVGLTMEGKLGLGPKDNPDYMPMKAHQIMNFPAGFMWTVKSGRGPLSLAGSDGFFEDQSWSRFWLMNSIPMGRVHSRRSKKNDHRRAAFGRLVAETVFWSPAALLTYEDIEWTEIDAHTVEATVKYRDLVQSVTITLDHATGQPLRVVIPRWSDANPGNIYQLQPFGGYPGAYEIFDGFRLPTHVEGGNFIGTDDYFPFYIADIKSAQFGP